MLVPAMPLAESAVKHGAAKEWVKLTHYRTSRLVGLILINHMTSACAQLYGSRSLAIAFADGGFPDRPQPVEVEKRCPRIG